MKTIAKLACAIALALLSALHGDHHHVHVELRDETMVEELAACGS